MEIEKISYKSLEFDKILANLAEFARLNQSKHACLNLSIYSDISSIEAQLKFTKEAKFILDMAKELPLDFVLEAKRLQMSFNNSYLSEAEIVDTAKTIRTSRLVRNFLKENLDADSLLNSLAFGLFSDKEFEDRIFESFDNNLELLPSASDELKSLSMALKDNEKNLKSKVIDLLNNPDFSKHLQEQIYTFRDERVVFQVRASSKSKVPGIMHDISASSQSFYIEPAQIVPLNNKIREIKAKISAEIIRILTEFTFEIKNRFEEIANSEEILTQLDVHFAKARYAVKLRAVEPELAHSKIIEIEAMRHPLLVNYCENIVENDFRLGTDYKSVVITGSNTGGKTVTIKTLGLFVLMMKCGMFLPCNMAKIYPFQKVFADIGDEQSIAQNLSTFSSHMKNLIEIVNNADAETFVLIDEICAGTDPNEGFVLAQVILEKLAELGAFSCVTTHFGELKALEFSNGYFKNACVEFNTQSLQPTYKLIIGIPGLSNAILISSNLGLDSRLIDKAKSLVVSKKDSAAEVVEKLQEAHQELSENLKQAEEIKDNSQIIRDELEKKLTEIKKDKKKTVKIIKDKLENELSGAKEEIKAVLDELRREKSEKIARRSYSRLAELEKRLRLKLNEHDEQENYDEVNWLSASIGDKVLLKELNQAVEILSLPDKAGNVDVQMGLIKTKVKKEKLAKFDLKLAGKVKLKFKKHEGFEFSRHDLSHTLDLRGYRVEDALNSLESYLDRASLANLTPVYIIHGHGTGALKSAIRDYIATSPYVAKFRYGEQAEGGDGVCVIDIN